MYSDWDRFRELKKEFDDNFEAWACESPEKLDQLVDDMLDLKEKVDI